MRLTLRTLLAWLDGVLPGDEQQQLSTKVASSAFATQLVERIRTAVGRTAIGAPQPDGRGLTEDPNSVAEYLDNTLLSEQLEAFERICLESEVHLAEVSACHGLLAEVSRDPALQHRLKPEDRDHLQQRLRGLLAGVEDRAATERAAAEQVAADRAAAAAVFEDAHYESRETARAMRAAMTQAAGVGGAAVALASGEVNPRQPSADPAAVAAPGRGARRGRSSLAAWISAAIAAALLLSLVGVLIWSLIGKDSRRLPELARAEDLNQPAAPVEEGANRPDDKPQPPPEEPAPAADAVAEKPVVAAAVAAETAVAAPATAEVVAVSPPAAAMTAPPVPTLVADAAPANAATDPGEPVGFVGGEGLLLRLAGTVDNGEWTLFPVGSALQQREDLLVPPGCQPELHVRGVTIRLLPETRAVLSLDADGTPRIEVLFGRAVARASRADARLGVTTAALVGVIDGGLLDPVAIQVDLGRFAGADPLNTPPLIQAQILATSRGLAWRQTAAGGHPVETPLTGIEAQGMLDAGMAIRWRSNAPGQVAVDRSQGLPPWIESGSRSERLEKAAGEVLVAKVATTTPLARALRELAADKRAENRMLAASTLALIGEFDDLVEQLAADGPGRKLEARQWTQLENATVPLALARGGSKLYTSFANRGPHGKADALWAMARGFTDEELAAGADQALVEALDDPSLIVRRYASKSLVDMTQPAAADRLRYRPDGLPDMRRDGVTWWRGQLEKGLLRRTPGTTADRGPLPIPTPPAGSAADPEAEGNSSADE